MQRLVSGEPISLSRRCTYNGTCLRDLSESMSGHAAALVAAPQVLLTVHTKQETIASTAFL